MSYLYQADHPSPSTDYLTLKEKSLGFEDTDKIIARTMGFDPLSSLSQAIDKTKHAFRTTEKKALQFTIEEKILVHDRLVGPGYRKLSSTTSKPKKKFDPIKHHIIAVLDTPPHSPCSNSQYQATHLQQSRESLVMVDSEEQRNQLGDLYCHETLDLPPNSKEGNSEFNIADLYFLPEQSSKQYRYQQEESMEEARDVFIQPYHRPPRMAHREIPKIDFSRINIARGTQPDYGLQEELDQQRVVAIDLEIAGENQKVENARPSLTSGVIFTLSAINTTNDPPMPSTPLHNEIITERTFKEQNDNYQDQEDSTYREYFSCLEDEESLAKPRLNAASIQINFAREDEPKIEEPKLVLKNLLSLDSDVSHDKSEPPVDLCIEEGDRATSTCRLTIDQREARQVIPTQDFPPVEPLSAELVRLIFDNMITGEKQVPPLKDHCFNHKLI